MTPHRISVHFALVALTGLGLAFAAPSAGQAQTIGETLKTTRTVLGSVRGERVFARLKSRDAIHRDQTIRTRSGSVGEFEFDDGTALAVGPNARLVLNEAVYGGPNSHELLTGAMRFVTNAALPATDIVVSTPVATIGVRGTIIDIFVEPGSGRTSALLVEGGPATACRGGACVTIAQVCDAVEVGGGGPSGPTPVSGFSGSRPNAELFPFAANAFRVRSVFKKGAARCNIRSSKSFVPEKEREDAPAREETDNDTQPTSSPDTSPQP